MLGNSISTLSCQVGAHSGLGGSIARLALAGIAETHRHDGDAGLVVEGGFIDPSHWRSRSPEGSSHGIPLACTRVPGA